MSVTRKTTGDHPLFLGRSICKAMESAFPGGGRLSCTRHLQGNAQEYLKDKVGLCDTNRTKIIKDIFGKDGLVEDDDTLYLTVGYMQSKKQ